MKRSVLSNLFLILLLNLLVKPFFILGIDAEVQNRVGEEAYGNYFALLNFSLVLNILLDLGITNFNVRNIAQNPQLISKHFARILALRISLFGLYFIFSLVLGIFSGYSTGELYILIVLLFNQFLVALIQFARSNFAGLHLFRSDAIISVLDRFLLILFCSVLLWTNMAGTTFDIAWFVYAQTLAYGITAITAFAMLRNEAGSMKPNLKRDFSIVLLRNSFPFALLIFLMMLYSRLDIVLLERLLPDGDVQAGIYAQGFRYLDAVNMFALLFVGILFPVFARLLKQRESVVFYSEMATRMLISASVVIGIVGYFFSRDLLEMRYDHVSEDAALGFGFLILSFIPISISHVYGTLLTANGNLKQLNYMALSCLVINLVLNLVFIPAYKVQGAGIAMLITQSTAAIIQLILAHKLLHLEVNWRIFGSLTSLAISLAVMIFLLSKYQIPSMTIFLTALGLAVILCFALGLIKWGDMKEMVKQK